MFKCINSNAIGDYGFQGLALTSQIVRLTLHPIDLEHIRKTIKELVGKQCYESPLVFENNEGFRILAIDNLTQSDKSELLKKGYFEEVERLDYYVLIVE